MAKSNGQEMVKILVEEQNPIELAEKMDDFINNFTADTEGFFKALKEEDELVKVRFSTISLLWLKKMNHYIEADWYDLRNKYSVETSQQLSRILGENLLNFQPDYTGYIDRENEEEDQTFEVDFVEKLSRTHRTLQQTFSGMVFHWLTIMNETVQDPFFVRISEQVNQNMEKSFAKTPMI
jgi:hypothetical protein